MICKQIVSLREILILLVSALWHILMVAGEG